MSNLKSMVKLVGQGPQKVIAGVTLRHDQMACQCRLGRTHGPYVQVVNAFDAR
jgi:hypothetical protein